MSVCTDSNENIQESTSISLSKSRIHQADFTLRDAKDWSLCRELQKEGLEHFKHMLGS